MNTKSIFLSRYTKINEKVGCAVGGRGGGGGGWGLPGYC